MCESKVFKIKDDVKEKLMEDVTLIIVEEEEITLFGLFGESRKLKGKISRIDSETHEVLIS
jgi:predicted RNA-binding protein